MHRLGLLRLFLILAVSAVALGPSACRRSATSRTAEGRARGDALRARRGPFERRLLLTGEVDAVSAAELKVPRIAAGRVTIRWLEADGTPVKAGAKVAELDNANFVAQVKERTLTVAQAEGELKRQEWQNQLDGTDRALDVQRKRAVMERARVDADVPEGILPKRDYLEKQLVLKRAQADLERAEETLSSQKRTAELDLSLKKIALEKVRRELTLAEEMIDALTLRAPVEGTVLVGDHWEGRKLQVTDEVPVGHTLIRLPDLRQIRVKAWLSDVDDGRIEANMPAEIVVDAYPDRVLAGRVLDIAPVAREASDRSLRRVFQVNVAIDRPPGGDGEAELRPGMSARVEVIADRRPDAVLIPRAALDLSGSTPAVRLASGARGAVVLGPCQAESCVVVSGVEPGMALGRGSK
jgi:multidrug resistance efflux pump